jgi:hypothetical protein
MTGGGIFFLRDDKSAHDINRTQFICSDALADNRFSSGGAIEVPSAVSLGEGYGQRPVVFTDFQHEVVASARNELMFDLVPFHKGFTSIPISNIITRLQ